MAYLADVPLSAIFLVSLAVMMALSEIGCRFGMRARGKGKEDIATLEAAAFGLLALMIGFTFAMALTRFEARREAVLSEASAIEAAALRARLLPAPSDAEAMKLLREYAHLRVAITRAPRAEDLRAGIARSNAIHEQLWQQAVAAAAKPESSNSAGLVIEALNDLIKAQQRRLAVVRNHVPTEVMAALYGIAALAVALSGYAQGLRAAPSRTPVFLTAALVCCVIILIVDIETPFRGFVHVNQQPLIEAAAQIAAMPPR